MNDIGLSDLEAVRLILSGNSVIDWDRANFRTVEEVNRFLKVQHFDLDDPVDRKRIRVIFYTAVDFLENHLQMPCDEDVKNVADLRQIFLWASDYDVISARQTSSCVVLKLMHVVQHLDAAELRHQAPLAEEGLLTHAEEQILSVKERDAGCQSRCGRVLWFSQNQREYHSQAPGKERGCCQYRF